MWILNFPYKSSRLYLYGKFTVLCHRLWALLALPLCSDTALCKLSISFKFQILVQSYPSVGWMLLSCCGWSTSCAGTARSSLEQGEEVFLLGVQPGPFGVCLASNYAEPCCFVQLSLRSRKDCGFIWNYSDILIDNSLRESLTITESNWCCHTFVKTCSASITKKACSKENALETHISQATSPTAGCVILAFRSLNYEGIIMGIVTFSPSGFMYVLVRIPPFSGGQVFICPTM